MKNFKLLTLCLASLLLFSACAKAAGSTASSPSGAAPTSGSGANSLPSGSLSGESEATGLTAGEAEQAERAKRFIQAFIDQDFSTMLDCGLDEKMKNAMAGDSPQSLYAQLSAQVGKPLAIQTFELVKNSGFLTVSLVVEHEKSTLRHNVNFDPEQKLVGYFIAPYSPPASGQSSVPQQSSASQQSSAFKTEEVTFGQAPFMLSGTLTYPQGEGPFAVCVLVHGSGPQDRDESAAANKPFFDLAEGLAAQGIATLRYDKRTFSYGRELSQAQAQDRFSVYDETIDDAVYALEFLSQKASLDPRKIFVIGHSLGANQAPRIAEKSPLAAGLIIMAGNVSTFQDLYLEQLQYLTGLDGQVSADEKTLLAAAESLQKQLNAEDYSAKVPASETLGIGYHYWKDFYRYNPTETALKLDCPILILQGERDYQVPPSELELWKKVLGDRAKYVLYPKLNHLFIAGEGQPNPQEYSQPGHVDAKVIADIAAFIRSTN